MVEWKEQLLNIAEERLRIGVTVCSTFLLVPSNRELLTVIKKLRFLMTDDMS